MSMPPPVKSETASERKEILKEKKFGYDHQKERKFQRERKFRYAHQMRDADISRMRKRPCETIVQVTAGIFLCDMRAWRP